MPSDDNTQLARTGSALSETGLDAITLLTEDHEDVRQLFEDYADLADAGAQDEDKRELVDEICLQLTMHSVVEEEIFYPAARDALGDAELVDEAEVEHQSLKDLIDELQGMSPADARYDEQVSALQQAVEHHVREEEAELFPLAADSSMNLEELGEQIAARKEDLLDELRGEDGFDSDED